MKTCWQILEIESTTQIDIIRQAYLARLPLCHPETDPQGFKALRQAYEEALRLAVNPVEEADDEEKDAATEHEILRVFRALLDSENDRFQPSAWQKFIQQLNTWNMEDVDQLRWPLCAIAIEARYLSLNCASLLAERLNWHSFNDCEGIDEEEREAFLEAIQAGDCFDFLSLLNIPLRCRTRRLSITSRWNVAAVTILTMSLRFWRWKVRGSFLMMRSCIANCCAGTARCKQVWRNSFLSLNSGKRKNQKAKMPVITSAHNGCTAARGKACLPISARTGKVTHLHKPIICCCSGASVIARIISRY